MMASASESMVRATPGKCTPPRNPSPGSSHRWPIPPTVAPALGSSRRAAQPLAPRRCWGRPLWTPWWNPRRSLRWPWASGTPTDPWGWPSAVVPVLARAAAVSAAASAVAVAAAVGTSVAVAAAAAAEAATAAAPAASVAPAAPAAPAAAAALLAQAWAAAWARVWAAAAASTRPEHLPLRPQAAGADTEGAAAQASAPEAWPRCPLASEAWTRRSSAPETWPRRSLARRLHP
mmetsp:Transcript_48464/g.127963  ORF Transcript_48464/g.127963 Transcript_48464/m.127963 type:complete len:233 (+) Transcript_48464:596-1294(+)